MPATLRLHSFPRARILFGAFVASLAASGSLSGQSLSGSPASLDRQNLQAQAHDFTYLRTPQQVRSFVDDGYLVPVSPTGKMELHQVSFPYARPEVRVFVERLAAQYHSACGEKLVVTSLSRPLSNQPINASDRSVHPTGMAVDLRRSNVGRCRQWLESTLLALEAEGVLEATLERSPPHYHIAVYPQPYAGYVARVTGNATETVLAASVSSAPVTEVVAAVASGHAGSAITHTVARGESLWTIARLYGVTENSLRAANGFTGSRILAGQSLVVPTTAPVGDVLRYTVQRGDSLWVIASRVGTTVDEIRRANGIGSSRIYAGQVLDVPVTR
jgi:LysM repeat protein